MTDKPEQEFKYEDEATKTISDFTLRAMEKKLYEWTEEYGIEKYPAEHRSHLGVSVIGDKCSRKLWYGFRWVKLKQFSGRMRRLFARGHKEEADFIDLLMWMGFNLRHIDEATGKQYCFSSLHGHYGGSNDSLAILPWFKNDRILVEYKTHNKRLFEQLVKDKLILGQPKHYAQMCGYGKEFKTKYGLYCAKNKNNEEIYWELVALDWNYAIQLQNKAEYVITSKFPPPRISDNPAYYECKNCDFSEICHEHKPVEINCRSCKLSDPIKDGKWFCNRYQQEIPKDFLTKGCADHVSINS